MVTKFRIYESLNQGKPKVGDYVICTEERELLVDFLSNNIGRIESVDISDRIPYIVMYDFDKNDIIKNRFFDHKGTRPFHSEEILYWSEDKKDLEFVLSVNKYNL